MTIDRRSPLLVLAAFVVFIMISASGPAFAAGGVELTTYVGLRSSETIGDGFFFTDGLELEDSLRVGLGLDLSLDGAERWWGVLLLEQEASTWELAGNDFFPGLSVDVDMFRYAVGLKRVWSRERVAPFAFANVGATSFESMTSRGGSSSQPTFGLGGGAQIPMSERLALRVDGEYSFVRIAHTDNDFAACVVVSCRRDRSNEMWGLFQLRVGLTYRFD